VLGSAAGASHQVSARIALGLLAVGCITAVWRHGALTTGACVVLLFAAAVRGVADRWQDAACGAELLRASNAELVAEMHLAAGGRGPATVYSRGSGCALRARVMSQVALVGGVRYAVRVRDLRGERSIAMVVTHATATPRSSVRARLRAAGIARVDEVFLTDAPMARALLLADMQLIEPALRQRWSRAGLVHLLSVSGVHVAIVASSLLMLGSALRLSPRTAALAALFATSGYVVILGLPAPAVRAAAMFAAPLVARLRQRPCSPWSVLTLGAALPVVVDSAAPLDLGWQLSVLGVVALEASGSLVRRLRWKGQDWRRTVRRDMMASAIASLASAPLIAWHFGSISLVAPLVNLVAAPLIAIAQPALFLALVCAPVPVVAHFVAGAVSPLLHGLDYLALLGSRPTWAAVSVAPTLTSTLLASAIVAALLAACVRARVGPPLIAAAIGAATLVIVDLSASRGSGSLELHMLDVGQGDALALRTPHGKWILVDAGGGAPGVDQGRRVVIPYVRSFGGDVAAFVLSHPHLDHVGGAPAIMGQLRPPQYFDGAFAGGSEAYRASLDTVADRSIAWQRVHPLDTVQIDGVTLRFLAPDSSWTASLSDANLASVVLRVEFGRVAMLLVGDAEREEEEWLLEHTPAPLLRADVLKVGHHGSQTSSSPDFLHAVQPRVALVSVGRGNRYGHPASDVLARFVEAGAEILRTDVAGTTVIRTDGVRLDIETAAARWTIPPR
jgi:competence protein ComEC